MTIIINSVHIIRWKDILLVYDNLIQSGIAYKVCKKTPLWLIAKDHEKRLKAMHEEFKALSICTVAYGH